MSIQAETVMNVEQRIRDIGFDGYVCGCGMVYRMWR